MLHHAFSSAMLLTVSSLVRRFCFMRYPDFQTRCNRVQRARMASNRAFGTPALFAICAVGLCNGHIGFRSVLLDDSYGAFAEITDFVRIFIGHRFPATSFCLLLQVGVHRRLAFRTVYREPFQPGFACIWVCIRCSIPHD